jgi:hypothetical protein
VLPGWLNGAVEGAGAGAVEAERQYPGPLGLLRSGSNGAADLDIGALVDTTGDADAVLDLRSDSQVGCKGFLLCSGFAAYCECVVKDDMWVSAPWLRALQDYNVPPFGEERMKVRW